MLFVPDGSGRDPDREGPEPKAWGYDAIAVFQPMADWNDEVHAELAGLEAGPAYDRPSSC